MDKLNRMSIMAYIWLQNMVLDAKENLKSERGDTNFISIMVILGIVCVVAAVFIGFKDQIVGKAQEMIEKLLSILGG